MSPSHARKRGMKYRYYLSSALFNGEAERAGSIRRVPAVEIEALVVKSVRAHLKLSNSFDDLSLVNTHVVRIEVQASQLVIQFAPAQKSNRGRARAEDTLRVPWQKTPSTRRREILLPSLGSSNGQNARPIRSETRATLVASIARGRRWLDEIISDPSANAETIAARESCSIRKVNMMISLAFLAPHLVKAAIEGRLPHGMGVVRLCDCQPNGFARARCWASSRNKVQSRTGLCPRRSPLPGNVILRPETKAPKRAPKPNAHLQRLSGPRKRRQLRSFRAVSENL